MSKKFVLLMALFCVMFFQSISFADYTVTTQQPLPMPINNPYYSNPLIYNNQQQYYPTQCSYPYGYGNYAYMNNQNNPNNPIPYLMNRRWFNNYGNNYANSYGNNTGTRSIGQNILYSLLGGN